MMPIILYTILLPHMHLKQLVPNLLYIMCLYIKIYDEFIPILPCTSMMHA